MYTFIDVVFGVMRCDGHVNAFLVNLKRVQKLGGIQQEDGLFQVDLMFGSYY